MKHYSQNDIFRYLSGNFTSSEVDALEKHIESCEACNKLLESETDFEIALLNTKPEKSHSTMESAAIDQLIEQALTETGNPVVKPKRKIFTYSLYALAAALVLAFGIMFFDTKETVHVATIPENRYYADTLKTSTNLTREQPLESAVVFGKNTMAIPSKSARLKVLKKEEKTALASLDTGSALFSVEKGLYSSFVVETPDAFVTVTGTVFDVWVSNGSTRVTVLEGNVKVNYKNIDKQVSVSANQVSFADSLGVNVRSITETDTTGLPSYKSLIPVAPEKEKTASSSQSENIISEVIDWSAKLQEAIAHSDNRNYQKAYDIYQEIVRNGTGNRNEEMARFESAMLLINHLGRKEDGIHALETYLESFNKGVYEEESLIELIKSNKNKPVELHKRTTKLITRYPDHPFSRRAAYENATMLREAGHFALATELYDSFVKLWPRDSRVEDALYWKGKSMIMAGDTLSGREILKTYTTKYPEGRWIKEASLLYR